MFQGISYAVLWLVVAIVLGAVEAVTLGLVTLWFALGAILAMLAALAGFSFLSQIIAFIVSSAILLYFTRPIARNYLKLKSERTNADRVIGETGVVIEKIDVTNGSGQVKVLGQVWSARSVDSQDIPVDTKIQVKEISGVKLLVKRIDE
ncbi:MAG: NfeD family protein [Clostridia bacterium]|nr:NfeD family protein [Clostridia bacterium]